MVSKMKVDELKMYSRLRGIKFTGIKAEVVARVFVASETSQPVNQTASLSVKTPAEIESDLQTEYQAKFLHGEILLPDPYYLTSCRSSRRGSVYPGFCSWEFRANRHSPTLFAG